MTESLLSSTTSIIVFSLYFVILLFLGYMGKQAKKENSLADFYLAGHSMGFITLLLTMYATQYSGNSLIGFPAKAYRSGFDFFVSISFMVGIIAVFWLFAPRLQQLAQRHHYITPGDYLQQRYRSRLLVLALNIIFIITLAIYILTNLKAMGYVVETATAGNVSFAQGILFLSLIMVIYESLGGMRSVAWSDAMQGITLFLGCVIIFTVIEYHYGGMQLITEKLHTLRPEFWQAPTFNEQVSWFSLLLLIAFSISIYPHAIQRIYAAKNAQVLKKSLQWMLLMPWITTLLVFIIGLIGITQFPHLNKAESEHIMLYLINDLATLTPLMKLLMIIFIAAAIAAIMSTVDSALLSISSLIAQDFYRPLSPQTSEEKLTQLGKIFSWLVMASMALLAIYLPQTIWKITIIKLELLIQAAPAMLLGIMDNRPFAHTVLVGLFVGVTITVIFKFAGDFGLGWSAKPLGIHAGIWGVMANLAVIGILSFSMSVKRT